jgi:hypothetical protein
MIEAENASYLPRAVVVVPEVDEAAFAVGNGRFSVGMGEPMHADFNGAVVMDAEHFKGAGC